VPNPGDVKELSGVEVMELYSLMNSQKIETNFLERIENPGDLKKLTVAQLIRLADEIREFLINTVSKTGGHLGSSLGVVELTLALHYFFESPRDKIIWDVGHQSYAHKIITGRKHSFHTLRQYGGISGFPKITESEHDVYGTGHASTSISAAMGFAKGRDLKNEQHEVIAVIGDGAFTGGNALEALNQAGYSRSKIIVVLNDNRMSIARNVGAFSKYAHRIEKTETYQSVRDSIKKLFEEGNGLREELIELKTHIKKIGAPDLLFEKLGFDYIGIVAGHDIKALLKAFEEARDKKGPTLIHVRTTKGKGYSIAEKEKVKYHGVNPFNIETGLDMECVAATSFTKVFGDALIELAERDKAIVAITAAMSDGTGLNGFKQQFPDRFFDVGIAEQHAVVFAAGLARQGFKPVCAIYSTFLQRAYDAIIHDVCLQSLPVIFCIDRAGLVGEDGSTHHGCFDLSYLRLIPNLIVIAPKNAGEMRQALFTSVKWGKPVAIRYPRGQCITSGNGNARELELGKCEVIKEGNKLAIISIGHLFYEAQQASELLDRKGISNTLINARFLKPLDTTIVEHIRRTGKAIVIEENTVLGGFGSGVLEACHEHDVKADIKLIGIPDRFIEHGSQKQLRKNCGLDCESIVRTAEKLCKE